jgi:hypothetical protein
MSDKELLGDAVDYIRSKWPYWDKYGGGRHFAIHTGVFLSLPSTLLGSFHSTCQSRADCWWHET